MISSRALQIPTISKLRLLHDNYIHDVGVHEHVTPAEQAEENSLLDSFMVTPVMKHTMHFLADKGTFLITALEHHRRTYCIHIEDRSAALMIGAVCPAT